MTTTVHELAHRSNDSIYVTMFWDSSTNAVTVAVTDAKTDAAFELVVGPDERALDVFHHPFAYAAVRESQRSSSLVPTP